MIELFLWLAAMLRGELGHRITGPVKSACLSFLSKVHKHPAFQAHKTKNRPFFNDRFLEEFWCPEEDSNLHTRRHMDLNHARLPIPPPGLCCLTGFSTCLCKTENNYSTILRLRKLFLFFSYPTAIKAALALHKNRFYAYCYIKSWGNPCQPVYPHKVDSRYGHLAINGIIKTRTRCQRVFLCLAPARQRVL